MILRGISFGPVLGASGVQGFFGEGYPYHHWAHLLGLNFTGMTFVAKTTTLQPRTGNMKLASDGITPVRLLPDCIHVSARSWLQGAALNAVGLSGPGAEALFNDGRWQKRTKPFMLSFMSVAETKQERMQELRGFVTLLKSFLPGFNAPIALQINFSCPNVGHDPSELLGEIEEALEIATVLDIPLIPKLNVDAPPEIAVTLSSNPRCDAICLSNTLAWGSRPKQINWKRLFGTTTSPLAKYGGGGLSGAPLYPIVKSWIRVARTMRATIPINTGGGILKPRDAISLLQNGADSVFIGSMAFLRPWNVQITIRMASNRALLKTAP